MELDIDYEIAARYGGCHDLYCRNLNVFKSFVRVFEAFFKKEKYQNAEIKIEEDAKNKATIKFCGKKYRLGLVSDPGDGDAASIGLLKMNKDQPLTIATAVIVDPENVVFQGNRKVSLKDGYEFNNAVLDFFITAITGKREPKTAGR
jgi:hypothetical protein